MTMYAVNFDERTTRSLDGDDSLRKMEELSIAYSGPLASDVKRRWPEQVRATVSPTPNDGSAAAFAQHSTLWVLDRRSPLYGIWGLYATTQNWVQNAERANVPYSQGYYKRIADELPPASSIRQAIREGAFFSKGFADELARLYPAPAAVDAQVPGGTPAGTPATPQPLKRPTLELTVIDNEIIANKTAMESSATEEHQGTALAGPGAWERFMKEAKPADFGLPKPILAFQEDSGEVTAATEEYESILEAARQNDKGAQEALRYLGLRW